MNELTLLFYEEEMYEDSLHYANLTLELDPHNYLALMGKAKCLAFLFEFPEAY